MGYVIVGVLCFVLGIGLEKWRGGNSASSGPTPKSGGGPGEGGETP